MNATPSLRNWSWQQLNGGTRVLLLLLCLAAANTSAQTYKILHSFTGGADGGHPWYAQLVASGTTLYGTASCGGTSNCGTVFKLNTDGTAYTVLKNFTGSDGSVPAGSMVVSGSTLYGTTEQGGSSNHGTVFKVNTDGSEYVVLKHFNGSDGHWPCGGLALSNTTLYGTTSGGGGSGGGTVFKLGTDGTGFTLLASFSFSSSAGSEPIAGPVLAGNTLYGTTCEGASNGGSVYRVNTDGSGFTVLKTLPASSGSVGIDGIWPVSPVVVSGTILYGTADWGGSYGKGTLFRLNTDGTGFTVLRHFQGAGDGAGIEAGLLLSGTTLYGTAYTGGDYPYVPPYYGHGTVFCINTDGSGFKVLREFSGSDGAHPRAGLVMSGTTLFGMTDYGGTTDNGVIFSLSVATPTVRTPPQSQTAELGSPVTFRVLATGAPALTYQWFFNATNAISGVTTNPSCTLATAQTNNGGAYSVVVSNMFGAVASPPAVLNVIVPVERRPVPCVKVTGGAGSLVNVDYAESLNPAPSWTPLGSVSLTGMSEYYFDLTLPLPLQRFYRAGQMGAPGVMPSLDLHLVPAITLTGSVGGSVRVDGINRFGPIDAWVTLDTVTLTNTSQLYFDATASGQPQRLYRLVPSP
jgi:uncharacterized repeat protein (TIGR03803 family)